MSIDEKTFNSGSYALSHLRHDLLRSISTISTIALMAAFILLTSSLLFGLLNEIEGSDPKTGLLEGRIPGSITMFEEFNLDQPLAHETKSSLVNFLLLTTVFVIIVGFFIMYNTMSIAVSERRSEIGVLRSVGFSSNDVMRIFLVEGGLIGLISFIAALFLGSPLILNVSAYLIERGDRGIFFVQPTIPLTLIIIVMAMTVSLCLGATYIAVRRAVSAHPVDLMRQV
ncbi:MAG: ABC transporter permease [Thermoplasmatota archaeon]